MSKISKIKMYDDYDYECMSLEVPNEYELKEATDFIKALASVGISTTQAVEAIRQVSEIWADISYNTSRVDANKDRIDILERKCNNSEDIVRLKYENGALRREINNLRSVLDATAENLNEKIDLEISQRKQQSSMNIDFNRIEENIFLKDIFIDFN